LDHVRAASGDWLNVGGLNFGPAAAVDNSQAGDGAAMQVVTRRTIQP
jgi:hypothetical protein